MSSYGVHDVHVHLLSAVPNASSLEVHGFGLIQYIQHPLVLKNGLASTQQEAVAMGWFLTGRR